MVRRTVKSILQISQVDEFLRMINDTYFDGQLDCESKEALKTSMAGADGSGDNVPRVTYSSDDETGTSPKTRDTRKIYFTY